jgi:hypothetical protein
MKRMFLVFAVAAVLLASTKPADARTPLRHGIAMTAGAAGMGGPADDITTLLGGSLGVEWGLSPYFALHGSLLCGAASGPVLSGLDGWGLAAQAGLRLYFFDALFTPYLGLNVGVLVRDFQPAYDDVGEFLGPVSNEAARKQAGELSGARALVSGSAGFDLSLRSGFTAAVEIQGGAISDQWMLGGLLRAGYRF